MGITRKTSTRNQKIHQAIKEIVRLITNSIPFKRSPSSLYQKWSTNNVLWLKNFPLIDGVHVTISSMAIIMGLAID